MRKLLCLFLLSVLTLSVQSSFSDDFSPITCDHGTGKSKNNFFPVFRLQGNPLFICDNYALSFLGEVGPRSYRVNGTWGFFSDNCHRFKLGGEYLGQKLRYKFPAGRSSRWLHQWALGGKYQYLFDCGDFLRGIQLEGAYARSANHSLDDVVCTDTGRSLYRRIGGSWFVDFGAGLILVPWECSNLVTSLTYDQVHYHRSHRGKRRIDGVGFNFDFQQALWRNISLGVKGQFKRPYNYLEVLLNWNDHCNYGDFNAGVFVNHVWGKFGLPSSTAVGLEASLSFGVEGFSIFPRGGNCGNECEQCEPYNCCLCDGGELAQWVSDPAVYMPQVLAVRDYCSRPGVSTLLLPSFPPGTTTFDVSQFFSGDDLTFTATNLPAGVTLSPNGILTVVNGNIFTTTQNITVTATGSCGSVSASDSLTLLGIPL